MLVQVTKKDAILKLFQDHNQSLHIYEIVT